MAFYKENGLKDVRKLHNSIDSVDNQISALELENNQITVELSSLNHSDIYVEAIAREHLGLIKQGEVVYEFVDAKKLNNKDF